MVEIPKLPECVDNTAKNLADKPSQAIGQTIADLWDLVLGSRVSFAAEKKKIKYAHDLEEFRKSLESEVKSIPEEKLVEPSMQIAAQSLVDSQYCVDSKELREMFAKLIARSMHADYSDRIHPSFSKIIQQLSPRDAQMLRLIYQNDVDACMPLVHIVGTNARNIKQYFIMNLPAVIPDHCSEQDAAHSIVILMYLGLVSVPSGSYFGDSSYYASFEQSDFYKGYQQHYGILGFKVEIEKRLLHLTEVGHDFISVCLA